VNLVVIVVDTLRFDAVGPVDTPGTWALGEEGVRFDKAFTTAPMTLPAHTSLFTSQAPHVTGVVVNGQPVPPGLNLLPEWLGEHGYRTAAVASMATLWQHEPKRGLDQGFDDFRFVNRDYTDGLDTARLFEKQLDELGAGESGTDAPWFLFVHLADPHEPYRSFEDPEPSLGLEVDGEVIAVTDPRRAPHIRREFELDAGDHELLLQTDDADFVMRSLYLQDVAAGTAIPFELVEGQRLLPGRRVTARFHVDVVTTIALETWLTDKPTQPEAHKRYASEVGRADAAVAGIVAKLKAQGLYDSSVILFTADHGEAFGEHAHNGHSENLFDELLHVPLVIKLPTGRGFDEAREKLAQQAGDPVSHVDLAPTLLDLVRVSGLPGAEGQSLLQAHFVQREVQSETHVPEASRDLYCLRDASLKLIFRPDDGRFQLFDVTGDTAELHDVFASRGHEREAWQQQLRAMASSWEGATLKERSPNIEALGY